MKSYATIFALTLAACFALQGTALKVVGGRFTKNESNFFSSLGRIQAGTVGKPDVMLLGSSITGRLPDRANGFEGFANMGCDGGSAVDALRAIDSGILPVSPTLVIEANTLPLALGKPPTEISAAMRRPWFQLGLRSPNLAAYARPAGFFYSMLLARRTGDYGNPGSAGDLGVKSSPKPLAGETVAGLDPQEKDLKDELVGIIRRLSSRSSRIVFVWLPPARQEGSEMPDWIHALIAETDSLWWDLGNEANRDLVTLTDGVHMAAPSAARTVVSLSKALQR